MYVFRGFPEKTTYSIVLAHLVLISFYYVLKYSVIHQLKFEHILMERM